MKRIGMVLLATLCLCSCTGNAKRMSADRDSSKIVTNNINELVMNDEKIKEWLDSCDEQEISIASMELLIPYEWDYITKHGFKPVSDKEFKERINAIFRINLDSSENYKKNMVQFKHFYEVVFPEWIENKPPFAWGLGCDDCNFCACFVKDYNFLTLEIPIDSNFEISDDGKVVPPDFNTTLYINNYIFHSSKAALTWLMASDDRHSRYFLKDLVGIFGYMGDKRLLEWVAKTNQYVFAYTCRRQSFLDFSPVLFNYDPDGTYHFHQEILDVMAEALPDDQTYLYELSGYLSYLRIDSGESVPAAPAVFRSFADQAETVARICYWGEKLVRAHHLEYRDHFFLWLFSTIGQDIYDAEFKRRNYYGLDGFEELWEESKKQVEEEDKQRPQEEDRG